MINLDSKQQPAAFAYLGQIEALASELERAMQAIGSNALAPLEASVGRQQERCIELARAAGELSLERQAALSNPHALYTDTGAADRTLDERIRIAALSLQKLNNRYAALLHHSGSTVRLFAGLCRSYTAAFQNDSFETGGRKAWSCEL